jgi:hypothetical protein
MQETFRSFLQELGEPSCTGSSGKEFLEVEVLGIMRKEGFSDEQIYGMPLKKLLDLFYDAYLWKANRILSKATIESFLNKMQSMLIKSHF